MHVYEEYYSKGTKQTESAKHLTMIDIREPLLAVEGV